MASELRVDTLKDSSGNNSVGMAYVAEGSAKNWVNFNQTDHSTRDSFNTASLVDQATGVSEVNFTSSMNTGNYAPHNSKGSSGYRGYHSIESTATGTYVIESRDDGGTEADSTIQIGTVHGDLA